MEELGQSSQLLVKSVRLLLPTLTSKPHVYEFAKIFFHLRWVWGSQLIEVIFLHRMNCCYWFSSCTKEYFLHLEPQAVLIRATCSLVIFVTLAFSLLNLSYLGHSS